MRKKVEFRTGSKDTYNNFCKENPEIEITFKDWCDILYKYSDLVRDYLLETGRVYRMPQGMGEFTIIKRKVKKIITKDGKDYITLPIDWKKTKEKGKRIYIMNYHTEGYKFYWLWIKKSSHVRFSNLWRFKAHRKSSRLLSKLLKSGKGYHNKYCEK